MSNQPSAQKMGWQQQIIHYFASDLRKLAVLIPIVLGVLAMASEILFELDIDIRNFVILTLITYLVFDAIFERIFIFDEIDTHSSIAAQQSTHVAQEIDKLARWIDQESENLIGIENRNDSSLEAKLSESNEVWVNGIVFDRFIHALNDAELKLIEKIEDGKLKLRILALDPEQTAEEISTYQDHLGTPTDVQSSLQKGLAELRRLKKKVPHENFEIKLFNERPSSGYLIINANTGCGIANISPYLYHIDGRNSPVLVISQANNQRWYERYTQDFERQWNAARPLDEAPS